MLVTRTSTTRLLEYRLRRILLSTVHQLWGYRIVDKDGTMVFREPLRKAPLSFQETVAKVRERAEQDMGREARWLPSSMPAALSTSGIAY